VPDEADLHGARVRSPGDVGPAPVEEARRSTAHDRRPNARPPAVVESPADAVPQQPDPGDAPIRPAATPAQLRRFIKSRPYVPLHELRRRFGLNGHDDDVVAVQLVDGRIWVGLPPEEGRMLGDLIRQGEVGCELSLDPTTPVVVGVFPMRPVPRS